MSNRFMFNKTIYFVFGIFTNLGEIYLFLFLFTQITSCNFISASKAKTNLDRNLLVAGVAIFSNQSKDDVVQYAQTCKQELGLSAETLAPWNCIDGLEIPITVNGKIPDDDTYRNLMQGNIACDYPSWLQPPEACLNYAFVQERNLSPDVKAVLLCRARDSNLNKTRAQRLLDLKNNPTIETFLNYYRQRTIALIWTNTKTGKTCFFDSRVEYAGYIPSPDDTRYPTYEDLPEPKFLIDANGEALDKSLWQRNAYSVWKNPSFVFNTDQCISCHTASPFITSPWLKQVYQPPRLSSSTPYVIIGDFYNKKSFPLYSVTTEPIYKDGLLEAQVCTSCHRISNRFECDKLIDYSVGLKSPVSKPENAVLPNLWMPPEVQNTVTTKEDWARKYKSHYDRLKCCCQNPNAINCSYQDINQNSLSTLQRGKGPEVCN